ncbi:MAG: leucine-rich repeat protein [Bacteroidaceae bacterium]|nr:leucine-rich repeat protein [Bacteroidaceae bacterium]
MKRLLSLVILTILFFGSASAQEVSILSETGTCGDGVRWAYDGYTLFITSVNKKGLPVKMDDYDVKKKLSPWVKKKLSVKKVQIFKDVEYIGSCAFANCKDLQEVIFIGTDVEGIGWGAFLNCSHLRNISLPTKVKKIGTIAFANCTALPKIVLHDNCSVGEKAFANCKNLNSLDLGLTTDLGYKVFVNEVKVDDVVRHALYTGGITRLPIHVNEHNCKEFGISPKALEGVRMMSKSSYNYDTPTSSLDLEIPEALVARNNTYALIIGNQNYRFDSEVTYAIHDAHVFADYCKKTLGIPANNIHLIENATKQMILEEELEDWVGNISDKKDKKLIIYYAGHGVPDVKNENRAYLLPTDVKGTNPKRGIALDEFYKKVGELEFGLTSIFMDACFSGVNRIGGGVSKDLRSVAIKPKEAAFGDGNVVVFSAAQGNEMAQGFPEEGHGLFTYYLLKEIRESNGEVSLGQLSENLQKNVSKKAVELQMRKKQTPSTTSSSKVADVWKEMTF